MDSHQLNRKHQHLQVISTHLQQSPYLSNLQHLETNEDIDKEIQFLKYLRSTYFKNPTYANDYTKIIYEIDEQIHRLEQRYKELKLLKLIQK